MNTAKTENGYSCNCNVLPNFIVSKSCNFEEFKQYVLESIDFYIECARKYNEEYPSVFDDEYDIIFNFV